MKGAEQIFSSARTGEKSQDELRELMEDCTKTRLEWGDIVNAAVTDAREATFTATRDACAVEIHAYEDSVREALDTGDYDHENAAEQQVALIAQRTVLRASVELILALTIADIGTTPEKKT